MCLDRPGRAGGKAFKDEDGVKLKKEMNEFYQNEYLPLQREIPSSECLSGVLKHSTDNIIVIFENNIKQNYLKYVERYINVIFGKKEYLAEISLQHKSKKITKVEEKLLIREKCSLLKKVKSDILFPELDKKNNPIFESGEDERVLLLRKMLFPKRYFSLLKDKTKSEAEKNVIYDMKSNPQEYFYGMIKMMKEIEARGEKIKNVFPLSGSFIPRSMCIDTTDLLQILFNEEAEKEFKLKKSRCITDLSKRDEYWKFFFKTKKRCFNYQNKISKFKFGYSIHTDGVGCSILLSTEEYSRENKILAKKNNKQKEEEKYLTHSNFRETQNKNCVAIDPNKRDLLFCIDDNKQKFRYTQNQRWLESSFKTNRNIFLKLKEENARVKIIEEELSKLNKKTLNIEEFKTYILASNIAFSELSYFYEEKLLRKLRLNAYTNTKRSEQNLVKNFSQKFGDSDNAFIAFGDYSSKNPSYHKKYNKPAKGKGLRSLFRKNGYSVFLIDEFRTSKKCCKCQSHIENLGELKPFLMRNSPRPWKRETREKVHGLLKCNTCKCRWNRDVNASSNIRIIAKSILLSGERPLYLDRSKNKRNDEAQTKATP